MEITRELVERIAHLARLTLSEEEKVSMEKQLEEILGSMADLDTLRLEEEPTFLERLGVLRKDEVKPGTERGELLKNAPETDEEYILAPGALGQGEQG